MAVLCRLHKPHAWHRATLHISAESYLIPSEEQFCYTSLFRHFSQAASARTECSSRELTKLKIEYQLLNLSGAPVPVEVTDRDWQKLATFSTPDERQKYLKYLHGVERDKISKFKIRAGRIPMPALSNMLGVPLRDNPERQTFMQRPNDKQITKHFLHNTVAAWRCDGPHLVLDWEDSKLWCGIEQCRAVKWTKIAVSMNYAHRSPFVLSLTGLRPELRLPLLGIEDKYLLDATIEPYVDRFPRSQLVYISSESPHVLQDFDADKVYVIGAAGDRCANGKFSGIAKARLQNIACYRLPLDYHVRWEHGRSRLLPPDVLIGILLDVNLTGQWRNAISNNCDNFFMRRESSRIDRNNKFFEV